jgi:hypothetical protein
MVFEKKYVASTRDLGSCCRDNALGWTRVLTIECWHWGSHQGHEHIGNRGRVRQAPVLCFKNAGEWSCEPPLAPDT